MQAYPHIPLADLGDVLQGLMPIIFVILYGIAHLVGNLQQEKRKAPPRPRPAQPPQDFGAPAAGAGKAPPANQPTLEETLRREVEEFLRRAQGGQPPQQQKPGAQRPEQQQRPQPRRTPAQRAAPTQPRGGRQSNRPSEQPETPRRLVEMQRPEPAAPITPLSDPRPSIGQAPLGSGVALHTQVLSQHTQTIGQHAQTLGADVAQADERMQQHLRQKFVHQVGALSPTTSAAERQVVAISNLQQLRALLGRPEGIRQIIIASEILRRPDDRWEN